MSKARRNYVPPKPKYREPSPKDTQKQYLQSVIEDLSKIYFGRRTRCIDFKTQHRRKEYFYKFKTRGFDKIIKIPEFREKVNEHTEGRYKFSFSGIINPKTGREDLFIYLIIYSQEGNNDARSEADAFVSQRSKDQCSRGVFGTTEISVNQTFIGS